MISYFSGSPTGIGNYPPGVTDNHSHFGSYDDDDRDEREQEENERQRWDEERDLLKQDAEAYNAWLDELIRQGFHQLFEERD